MGPCNELFNVTTSRSFSFSKVPEADVFPYYRSSLLKVLMQPIKILSSFLIADWQDSALILSADLDSEEGYSGYFNPQPAF